MNESSTSMNQPLTYLFALLFLMPLSNAYACVGTGDGVSLPIFASAFIIAIIATSFITLVIWLTRKVFRRKTSWHLLLCLSTVTISVFVGFFGSFGIPQYVPLFEGYGADLPQQTIILLNEPHLLWLPLGLNLGLWHITKNSSNKLTYFMISMFVLVVLLASVIWALYSPIFKMGALC